MERFFQTLDGGGHGERYQQNSMDELMDYEREEIDYAIALSFEEDQKRKFFIDTSPNDQSGEDELLAKALQESFNVELRSSQGNGKSFQRHPISSSGMTRGQLSSILVSDQLGEYELLEKALQVSSNVEVQSRQYELLTKAFQESSNVEVQSRQYELLAKSFQESSNVEVPSSHGNGKSFQLHPTSSLGWSSNKLFSSCVPDQTGEDELPAKAFRENSIVVVPSSHGNGKSFQLHPTSSSGWSSSELFSFRVPDQRREDELLAKAFQESSNVFPSSHGNGKSFQLHPTSSSGWRSSSQPFSFRVPDQRREDKLLAKAFQESSNVVPSSHGNGKSFQLHPTSSSGWSSSSQLFSFRVPDQSEEDELLAKAFQESSNVKVPSTRSSGKSFQFHPVPSSSSSCSQLFDFLVSDDEYQSKYKQASRARLEIDKLRAKAQLVEDEQLAIAIQNSLNVEDQSKHGNGNSLQLHPVSSSDSSVCAGCKSQIGPEYVKSYMGADWHPECFRCHGCDLPIADIEISASGDHLYHESCYRERHHPRCYVCKNYLPVKNGVAETAAHLFWMEKYCRAHEQDGTPLCCSCDRMEPTDERYELLDDGRKLCPECRGSAIMDTDACRPLYLEVQGFYQGMNMKVDQQIPLRLVAREALNDAMQGETNGHHGSHETRGLHLGERRNVPNVTRRPGIGVGNQFNDWVTEPYKPVDAILILRALPRLLTGSILAHEMMHAWLQLEGYPNLSLKVEEGICQVMAYLWLNSEISSGSTNDVSSSSLPSSSSSSATSKKGKYSASEIKLGKFFKYHIETDISKEYGEGFTLANEAVEKHGLRKTLDHIRLTGTYPL